VNKQFKKERKKVKGLGVKTFHVHELAELKLSKWPHCQKPSTDSMQYPSNSNDILQRIRKKILILLWSHNTE
jgi:hypothetical protein